MKMSKWTILSLILGGGGLLMSFIGECMGLQGQKEEIIDEIKEDYLLVPRTKKSEEE